MKVMVVYDSLYGNTRAVAQAIGTALPGQVQVLPVDQVSAGDLESSDLIVIGSPTHGAMPTEAIRRLLVGLGAPAKEDAKAATFDTRLTWFFLEPWGGFAAPKMAEMLREKGWGLVGEPGGFFVGGLKKGPLKRGEVDRAAAWASGLLAGR